MDQFHNINLKKSTQFVDRSAQVIDVLLFQNFESAGIRIGNSNWERIALTY